MTKRDYVLKKNVREATAQEAIAMDASTPVHEVVIEEREAGQAADAVGFKTVAAEEE